MGRVAGVSVIADRPHLRTIVRITLVVGTVLFCINQLDVVLHGKASTATWVKGAITYVGAIRRVQPLRPRRQ